MIISNTSPLINLAKVGKLDLMKKLFNKVLIPYSVYEEILKLPKNTETIIIKKAIEQGWLSAINVALNDFLRNFSSVDVAELEVIALAIKEKKPVLIDDKKAVKIAMLFDLEVHGTLYIILKSVKQKILKKEEAKKIVDQMMDNKMYLSSDVYALFLNLLNSLP